MKKIIAMLLVILSFKQINAKSIGQYTGLEIPRFVSTKTTDSNLRVGADTSYPIIVRYVQKNIPLQIIDEYKNWRKIEDFEGNVGWLHKRLIKGNRFAIINSPYSEFAQIYTKPKGELIGKIGKRNIVKLNKCLIKWCQISIKKHRGWISKFNLWGVFDKEKYNLPFYQIIINKLWEII